jgi:hypothetical protein
MDSRDIKEPAICEGGDYLQGIYNLQKELIDHYVKIEGLPSYPLNVNTKPSQILLKDFTGRVIEELAEAYEAMEFVADSLKPILTDIYQLRQGDESVVDDELMGKFQIVANHLQNVGEELADALHFFVELLIYANINPGDLDRYADAHLKNDPNHPNTKPSLSKLQILGMRTIQDMYTEEPYRTLDLTAVAHHLIEGITIEDLMYLKCGGNFNHSRVQDIDSKILWQITYHLNIARNFLKNKPWKKSEVMTQEAQYQEQLVKAFILLMGYFKHLGCTPDVVFFLYFKKNRVNAFRIKSNY